MRTVSAVALSLAFASPAAANELPPGPLSAETLTRLGARDGLLAEGDVENFRVGSRWIASQRTAELDGAPPREIIVEVTEYTGEGTWQTEYRAYRAGDPLPTPAAPPIVSGGYRDPGYLRVEDLDGDGRDALIVVGDTDGGSPSTIDVWRWRAGQWQQGVWGPDVGLDYVVFDVGADPAGLGGPDPALVALRFEGDGFAVEPWLPIDGRFRPWPIDPTPLLVPLMAHLAEHDPPMRPDHVWPRLSATVRAAGLDPGRWVAHLLQRQHGRATNAGEHAVLIDAMAWPGSPALDHIRRFVGPPNAPYVQRAAIEALGRIGDDRDHGRLLTLVRDPSSPREVLEAVMWGFAERGDPRARASLAAGVLDAGTSLDRRRALIRALGNDTAAVPDLARALGAVEPPLRPAIIDALWARSLSDAEHPAWRVPGVIDAIRSHVSHGDRRVVSDVIAILKAVDPDVAATLRGALPEAPAPVRVVLCNGLAQVAPEDAAIGAQVEAALAALERSDLTALERASYHGIVARHGHDTARARGLALLGPATAERGLLGPYLQALADAPPSDRAAIEAITGALLPLTGPDRPDRVRQDTARALGHLDDDRARAALMLLMRADPVVYVRSTAAEALGRRHPDVEAALIVGVVRESDESVRGEIIEALGKHGTPRARATLIDRLSHPRDGWAACHALARVPDAAALEMGAVLARHAAAVVEGQGGCKRVETPIGALTRAGLAEAEAALRHAIMACPARRKSLVTHAIDGWQREGSQTSRRRVAAFLDDEDRVIGRAAWRAIGLWKDE